jgi:zinc/manganese transport system substrate-binding protein
VFACEPEWGALATELGGPLVDVSVATSALQDVHQIEAKPSLIAKVRKADFLACTGAELEVGWLPQLIRQAGNQKVAGGDGYFLAASQVQTLDKPSSLDRAAGDVHPQGNPHVQLDPYRMLAIAKAMSLRLQKLDAANAATYQARYADFSKRWGAAIKRWEAKAAPLKGKKVIVHHISWVYLNTWLGLQQVGALEPKPGVPPTSGHLAELIALAKSPGRVRDHHRRLPGSEAARPGCQERTGVPRWRRCPSRRWRRAGEGTCSACSTPPSTSCWRPQK